MQMATKLSRNSGKRQIEKTLSSPCCWKNRRRFLAGYFIDHFSVHRTDFLERNNAKRFGGRRNGVNLLRIQVHDNIVLTAQIVCIKKFKPYFVVAEISKQFSILVISWRRNNVANFSFKKLLRKKLCREAANEQYKKVSHKNKKAERAVVPLAKKTF